MSRIMNRPCRLRPSARHVFSAVCALVLSLAFLPCSANAYPAEPGRSQKPSDGKGGQESATTESVQDPVKTQLEKEKLALEIEKLRLENANAERSLATKRGWLNLLYGNVSVMVAIILGFWGLFRYLRERREELLKREDERFEEVVKGLGGETNQQRVSSAVLLPTFLREGYERFYLQVFNLAAGNLRGQTDKEQSGPLSKALISVFRQSYPLARTALTRQTKTIKEWDIARQLNAAGVNLDRAFLAGADLSYAWLRGATFRYAILRGANVTKTVLEEADCVSSEFAEATMSDTNLKRANFSKASLESADLSGARADGAKFKGANLTGITMRGGTVGGVDFSGANLTGATFRGVTFASSLPDGVPSNPEESEALSGAVFEDVEGLTFDQIESCKARGAIFKDRAN